jgi:hypothetical protein
MGAWDEAGGWFAKAGGNETPLFTKVSAGSSSNNAPNWTTRDLRSLATARFCLRCGSDRSRKREEVIASQEVCWGGARTATLAATGAFYMGCPNCIANYASNTKAD